MTEIAGGSAFQYLNKDSLKKGISIEDVYHFLSMKGVSGKWIDTETILFETACHNHIGEGSHKLYYYQNTQLFRCYTGGCGTFDLFELIQKMHEVEDEWSDLNSAIKEYNDSQEFVLIGDYGEDGELLPEREYKKPTLLYYNPSILNTMSSCVVKDWVEEGISQKTQEKYEIKHSPISGSAVFPHYDVHGNCVGIRQRLLAQDEIERFGKYRPYNRGDNFYSSPLSFYSFGLNHNAEAIKQVKKAIVLEGEKSVLKMDDLLGPNNNISTASFGMSFSRHQFETLRELGVEEVVIGYDKQFKKVNETLGGLTEEFKGYMRILEAVERRVGGLGITITYMVDINSIGGYKDAPVDSGLEVFSQLYRERRTLEEWKKEIAKYEN